MENFTIDSWTTLLDVVLTASAPEGAFLKATTTTTMPIFDNSTDTNDTCDYETITDMHTRLAIFVPLGVLVGLLCTIMNAVVGYFLFLRLHAYNNSLMYLAMLSVCDTFFGIVYIVVMPMSFVMEWLNNTFLYTTWISTLVPMTTCAQLLMTSSAYLIVSASIEKYFSTKEKPWTNFHRLPLIGCAFILALIFKGTYPFELTIIYETNCTGRASAYPSGYPDGPLGFETNPIFYTRTLMTIVAPFVVLLIIHGSLYYQKHSRVRAAIAQVLHQHVSGVQSQSEDYLGQRAATRMLFCVVGSFLLTNALHVGISVLELIDIEKFSSMFWYPYASDCVSLLSIVCSAVRPGMYYMCNPQMAAGIDKIFAQSTEDLSFNSMEEIDMEMGMNGLTDRPIQRSTHRSRGPTRSRGGLTVIDRQRRRSSLPYLTAIVVNGFRKPVKPTATVQLTERSPLKKNGDATSTATLRKSRNSSVGWISANYDSQVIMSTKTKRKEKNDSVNL